MTKENTHTHTQQFVAHRFSIHLFSLPCFSVFCGLRSWVFFFLYFVGRTTRIVVVTGKPMPSIRTRECTKTSEGFLRHSTGGREVGELGSAARTPSLIALIDRIDFPREGKRWIWGLCYWFGSFQRNRKRIHHAHIVCTMLTTELTACSLSTESMLSFY